MSSESGVSLLFEIFFVTKISVVLTALTIVPVELFLLISHFLMYYQVWYKDANSWFSVHFKKLSLVEWTFLKKSVMKGRLYCTSEKSVCFGNESANFFTKQKFRNIAYANLYNNCDNTKC